jgi:hypothetical protein
MSQGVLVKGESGFIDHGMVNKPTERNAAIDVDMRQSLR